MADAKKKNQEAQEPEAGEQQTQAKKGGLIKYAIYGVIGLVAVVGIAFGTLMLIGGFGASNPAVEETGTAADSAATHADNNGESLAGDAEYSAGALSEDELAQDSILDFMSQDESVLEALMANLEVLDYDTEGGEIRQSDSEAGMTVEDSIEAANWIADEKVRLTEWEQKLSSREKSLNVLDSKVQQKILRIEQAESVRIAKLAKLYDGMDAQSVARLVSNLDDETVVALLPRMKLKNASSVMALMPPARAARLSKQMITIAEN
jgi:flagellar motility protein MotE (MotC chaperone)